MRLLLDLLQGLVGDADALGMAGQGVEVEATDSERRFCQSQPVTPIPSACSVKEYRSS